MQASNAVQLDIATHARAADSIALAFEQVA